MTIAARFATLTLLGIACTTAQPRPAPRAPSPDPLASERQALQQAEAALAAKDLPLARQKFAVAIGDSRFAELSGAERHRALYSAGWAANELKEWREAQGYLGRSGSMPDKTNDDLIGMLIASHALHDLHAVVETLTTLARFDPTSLHDLEEWLVFGAFRDSRDLPPGDDARFRLLDSAFDAEYVAKSGQQPAWVWRDLAALLLDRGDAIKATRVALRVTAPSILIELRADKRFEQIVQANPEHFDIARSLELDLARSREAVRKAPRSLGAVTVLISALGRTGRDREALIVADEALTRVDSSPVAPYDDVARALPWVRNARSNALWRMGRWQAAIEELKRAMKLDEDGGKNTSQVINLAERYYALERPKEALAVLASVGPQSRYGAMELTLARLQAESELGDAAAVARSLEYLRAHEGDAPESLALGLLVVGKFDEAARVLIAQLDDPLQRAEALHSLQDFKRGPEPPSSRKRTANWKKLLARQDVKAAVARVGKIEHYEFPAQ
jgi:tetratricopeptide (TPR) repeat protein